MVYTTIITSKGTTTIPADLREKLHLKEGDTVRFEESEQGRITISRALSLEEIRKCNQAAAHNVSSVASGDGFSAHVREKYGKK